MSSAFRRILLGYDDSEASRIALAYACALAQGGTALTVAHAVNESTAVASAMATTAFAVVDPTPLISAVIEEGAATLQAAVDACAARGVNAEKLFIRESPEAAVIALGHGDRFDLVVLERTAGTASRAPCSAAWPSAFCAAATCRYSW